MKLAWAKPTKLFLVRHTSVDVPKGICYGITDVPLAPTFQSELEQVRQKLGTEKFDAVFSSPLSRCTKLATEIYPENNIRTDTRLTELNFGDWEMADWNSIFDFASGKAWFADYVNTRCPNGESLCDLIWRGKSFLTDLQHSSYGQILIFTHAGMIRAFMCLLQHKNPDEAFRVQVECGQIVTLNLIPE